MKRHTLVFLVLAAFVGLPALLPAQQARTVTGHVVIAETTEPLEAARVMVRGTTIGTYTDRQGNFTLRVPEDARTIVISYIGFKSVEAAVADRVDVVMERQAIALEGIVVTALGMHREKMDLGYSVQDIEGAEIMKVPKLNLVNSLKGTIAGVQVTDAGPTGGTSRVVIRGSSSIAGNNQPLFVVDGIPVDNSAAGAGYGRNRGYGGIDYGNAVQDIDPANIESISVLKGPNAAALYGSRASNGAIVITTKSARSGRGGGLGISASTSFTMEQPLRLPRYQNVYGQGVNGEFDWVDGAGAGTWDFVDESWGPKMDGRLINQFTGAAQPWVPHPDNVRSFFRTGRTWTTNAAVSQVGDRSNVRLSVTNTAVE
ncbi:MAG: TonB-dependent receptor plug domain-containing protein, partial [Gemmatimonadetes bacterium]|nr:TonB-dependent receptor plug domain-containing protein [Gemmatimonadota bacterium]